MLLAIEPLERPNEAAAMEDEAEDDIGLLAFVSNQFGLFRSPAEVPLEL